MIQNNIIRKIELDNFSNQMALDMGMTVLNLSIKRNQSIAIEVARLNYTVFLYIDDGLSADKIDWLRRKANVAKRFEESSLSVKSDLITGNMTLEETFGLNHKDFIAKGGSIPIFVKNSGMVATITVSGLRDDEDHQIILEALKDKFL